MREPASAAIPRRPDAPRRRPRKPSRISRILRCFPAGAFRVDKYWPSVNRVDNTYGDRNLVCSCPPMETYIKAAE